ncbi:MAG TPA: calcium-binding protein [Planctomycetota bacterium]|nr:calcium-binding protein [Planctomycetota bacterium]
MRRALRFGTAGAAALGFAATAAMAQETTRSSVDSVGTEANNQSFVSGISADGRYVAFYSDATNLVAGDTNLKTDCFVKDTLTGAVTRVSVRSSGVEANGPSSGVVVSKDGIITAFQSDAKNMVNGDLNATTDVFMHNSSTGNTKRISVDSIGTEANGASQSPIISADGSIIAYSSQATNLVAGDTNAQSDIFVYEVATATTTRVSVDSGGVQGNGFSYSARISANGQFIFFYSDATNLVAGDTNAATDAFVHDRSTGVTERVSVDSAGVQGNGISYNGTITGDGSVVAFYSLATNLVAGDTNGVADVFVHDRITGVTTRVSVDSAGNEGNALSATARISADGKFVAFYSDATNLVSGDTNAMGDVFRHDMTTGETIRLSLDSAGVEGNGLSQLPWNSEDGRITAFNSTATNLVASDTNAVNDVFRRDSCVPANWFNYGFGWAGTFFTPTITPSAPPVFGTTISLNISNSSGLNTSALLMLGVTEANIPTGKGGSLMLVPIMFIPLPLPPGGFALSGTLPAMDPALCGFEVDFQAIELDAGATKGYAFTDGLALTLGI